MFKRTDESADSPTAQRPDPSLTSDFFAAKAHLFPLTAFNDEALDIRSRGKRPWRKGWNKPDAKPLTPEQARRHMLAGRNIGDRLKATDLVIDIDPRNFDDGADLSDPRCRRRGSRWMHLRAWCTKHQFDMSDWPIYLTGSGGLHVRLKKPAERRILGKLPDRPGFEFKTAGTFVVAAGSVHAKTERLYRRHPQSWLGLRDAPEAPAALLDMLAKSSSQSAPGGGELTPEQLAGLLAVLDPTDYGEHDKWFSLMCACHEATGGQRRGRVPRLVGQ